MLADPGVKKPVLVINMDETACRLHYESKGGLAVRQKDGARTKGLVQNVSIGQKRGSMTLFALICNESSVQPLLPQIVLCNERTLSVRELAATTSDLPPNVQVWRRKSAWATKLVVRALLVEIWKALLTVRDKYRIVLVMDTCPAHVDEGVLNAASRRDIRVVYVPPKLTWLLQPLDTHGFARFKLFLANEFRRRMLHSGVGQVPAGTMLVSIGRAVRKVLQGTRWAKAFADNGFGEGEPVRKSILLYLQLEAQPAVSDKLPSLAQFVALFPANREPMIKELTAFARYRPNPVEVCAAPRVASGIVLRLRRPPSVPALEEAFSSSSRDPGPAWPAPLPPLPPPTAAPPPPPMEASKTSSASSSAVPTLETTTTTTPTRRLPVGKLLQRARSLDM